MSDDLQLSVAWCDSIPGEFSLAKYVILKAEDVPHAPA
jgi:hypothetical protein